MDKVIDTKNAIANLMKAVDAVQKGAKLPSAAQKFNIPVSILFNKISSISRNKKMNSPPGTSKDIPLETSATPDKYGMVINEKLFKHRKRKKYKNDLTVFVSEKVYQAIYEIKSGVPLLEIAHKYSMDKRVLIKKLGEVKRYRASITGTGQRKLDIEKRKIDLGNRGVAGLGNQNASSFCQTTLHPYVTAKESIMPIIRRIYRVFSLDFPEDVINCISELEKRIISYDEVIPKYGFKLVHLATIIRNLKQTKRKRMSFGFPHAEKIYNALKQMIPSYSGSPPVFNEDLLPKRTHTKDFPKSELLVKAVWALNGGMTMIGAARKFGIVSQDLHNVLNILGIRKKLTKPGFVWRRKSGTVSEAELSQLLDEKIYKKPVIKSSSNTHRVKRRRNKMPLCLFCHQLGNRDVELGKLHIINKIAVHYYCLLFSSALEQNGNDNEGVLGFLPKDIVKEINRGNKLKCFYCGEKGATIGCNNKYCKKTYHFPCGLDNYAQYIFTDNFSSMCVKHRHFQDGTNKGEKVECPICKEDMIADPKFAVWSPCCKKSSWFHKLCLQKMALSAGYFFKCPLCNDKNTFVPEMLRLGIFVPEQDASWELEPNAFQELLERPILCDAPKCRCPSGRKSDEEGTKWEVLLCHLCGSSGIHIACGKLQSNSSEWNCAVCSEMLQESALRSKQENRIRRAKGRRKRDQSLSDEDDMSVEGTPKKDCLYRSLAEDSPSSSSLGRDNSFSSSFDVNVEDEVFVPQGIQGDVIIAKLRKTDNPLSDALKELEAYAKEFPIKLTKTRFSADMFLDLLNGYLESGDGDSHTPFVNCEHLRKFTECELNYDQMRLLRKSFEMCFTIQVLKMKILQSQRQARENPFNGRKYITSHNSRQKKMNGLKKSLVNLLSKAREANLLHENNTWSDYYESLEEKTAKDSASQEFTEPSTSKPSSSFDDDPSTSYRYIRVIEVDGLQETCNWCNFDLCPGKQPFTVFLSCGMVEVICTACQTCNVFRNLFPQVLFPRPSRRKNYREPEIDIDEEFELLREVEDKGDVRPSISTRSSHREDCKKEIKPDIDQEHQKRQQSTIYDFFAPKKKNPDSESNETDGDAVSVKSEPTEGSENLVPSSSKKNSVINQSKMSRRCSDLFNFRHKIIKEIKSLDSTNSVTSSQDPNQNILDQPSTQVTFSQPCSKSTVQDALSKPLNQVTSSILSNETTLNEPPSQLTSSPISSNSSNQVTLSQATINKPSNQAIFGQQSNQATFSKPSNQATFSKPSNQATFSQQSNHVTFSKPSNQVTFSQQSNQASFSKPSNQATFSNPSNQAIFSKPSNQVTFSQQSNQASFSKPSNQATFSNPSNQATFSNPSNQAIFSQQSNQATFSKPSNKATFSQQSNQVISDPSILITSSDQTTSNPTFSNGTNQATLSKPSNQVTMTKVSIQSSFCTPPSSKPPIHSPMWLMNPSVLRICNYCSLAGSDSAEAKKSTICCCSCKNMPSFCSNQHFGMWHTFSHNWMVIPSTLGNSKPLRRCKVCSVPVYTRYYCPACPWNLGYCSLSHYEKLHSNNPNNSTADERELTR